MMIHLLGRVLVPSIITILLFVTEASGQSDSYIETNCPGDSEKSSFNSTHIKLDEKLILKHFKEEVERTDKNWSNISCGMSVKEVSNTIWITKVEELIKQSRWMTIYYNIGRRELQFYKGRLVRALGPTAIKVRTDTRKSGNALFRYIQNLLKKSGQDPGPIDGRWGKKTESALREYQRQHGLPDTGVVDAKTRESMGIKLKLK